MAEPASLRRDAPELTPRAPRREGSSRARRSPGADLAGSSRRSGCTSRRDSSSCSRRSRPHCTATPAPALGRSSTAGRHSSGCSRSGTGLVPMGRRPRVPDGSASTAHHLSDVAFFPGFPALIRGLSSVTRLSTLHAAIVLSFVLGAARHGARLACSPLASSDLRRRTARPRCSSSSPARSCSRWPTPRRS